MRYTMIQSSANGDSLVEDCVLESLENHAGLHKVQILTGHPGTLKYTLFHLLLVGTY